MTPKAPLGVELLAFIQEALKVVGKLNEYAADVGLTVDVLTLKWGDGADFGQIEWDDGDVGGWAFFS